MGNEARAVALKRTLSALGLCRKARKMICGTPMICDALAGAKKPFLVLSASDNSENTQKRLRDRSAFYGVELIVLDIEGETLAKAVGKSGKLSAVALTDKNLCQLVRGSIQDLSERA